jgi:hypothetical protein
MAMRNKATRKAKLYGQAELGRPKALPDEMRVKENKSITGHIPVTQGGGKIHVHELSAGRYFVHFTQTVLKFECSLAELKMLGMMADYIAEGEG